MRRYDRLEAEGYPEWRWSGAGQGRGVAGVAGRAGSTSLSPLSHVAVRTTTDWGSPRRYRVLDSTELAPCTLRYDCQQQPGSEPASRISVRGLPIAIGLLYTVYGVWRAAARFCSARRCPRPAPPEGHGIFRHGLLLISTAQDGKKVQISHL